VSGVHLLDRAYLYRDMTKALDDLLERVAEKQSGSLMQVTVGLKEFLVEVGYFLSVARDAKTSKPKWNELYDELVKSHGEKMLWVYFWIAVQDLLNMIRADESFHPDVIVSIGRSGAVVGALLAGNLGELRHLGTDRINTYEGGERRTEIKPSMLIFSEELKEKEVLLVMAECHAGETLARAKENIKQIDGIKVVKTAALFRREGAHFQPDYVAVDNAKYGDLPFRMSTWKRSSQF
jgi:hypoxanthine phosphoribosyltransferase